MQKRLEDLLIGVRHFSPAAKSKFVGEPERKGRERPIGREEERGALETIDWGSHGETL
jgi:hypothetical protein